jgi:hypothetical protein
MLLYITAEDVFGDAAPEPRGPRPQPGMPLTLSALYDRGMRHHRRRAAFRWPEGAALQFVPDWKLDRLVIRIALYCREKLGLEPGTRAAVFGKLGWLWPAADFAIQGFGATAVGIEHDVPDEMLGAALRDADPRVVFCTDDASTARLLGLHIPDLRRRPPVVATETAAPSDGVLPLRDILELGGTLDTPERAQAFRMVCRHNTPESLALWHVGAQGVERLTHARAMEHVAARLHSRPTAMGDVVCLEPPRMTLAGRLAVAAFVGDGNTETVLGSALRDAVTLVRPHGIRASADWLEAACRGRGPRWPAAFDRRRARTRLHAVLGDRLRWIETERPVDEGTAAALAAVGANVVVVGEGVLGPTPMRRTHGVIASTAG